MKISWTMFLYLLMACIQFSFNTALSKKVTTTPTSIHAKGTPKITWLKDTFDFAEVPKGIPVTGAFEFINNGDAPLVIINAQSSCGCMVADYPKEPIAPGKKSAIKVKYDASAAGNFTKVITVRTNASEVVKVLTIKGNVLIRRQW